MLATIAAEMNAATPTILKWIGLLLGSYQSSRLPISSKCRSERSISGDIEVKDLGRFVLDVTFDLIPRTSPAGSKNAKQTRW